VRHRIRHYQTKKNWKNPDHILLPHFCLWEVVLIQRVQSLNLWQPQACHSRQTFILRFIFLYWIRWWMGRWTRWEQLADRLLRLMSQVITLEIPMVCYLMASWLTIGTTVLWDDVRFSLGDHLNCLICLFKPRWPMQNVKLVTVSPNHSTTCVKRLWRKLSWLSWITWPSSSARRLCQSQRYLLRSRGYRVVWGCWCWDWWLSRNYPRPICFYLYHWCWCDR